MLTKIEHLLKTNAHIGVFLLRLFIGLRLIYGVLDNVVSWEKMEEFAHFLEIHRFPFPLISAIVSVYAQLLGGLAILIGYKIRIFSCIMAINFLVALIGVHVAAGDSVEGMTPALAILFSCLTFMFTGAGKIALDKD